LAVLLFSEVLVHISANTGTIVTQTMTSVLASLRAVSVELPMWQKLICGAGAALALSWSTNTLLAAWEKRRPRYELSRVKVQPENGAAEPYSVNLHVKYELRDPNGPTIGM
jgi:hypothetical protein